MAEAATIKEALWLKKLMAAFNEAQGTMQLYSDNQARGEVSFQYCSTADMLADKLTKALPRPKYQEHRAKSGLVELKMRLCRVRGSVVTDSTSRSGRV
jgi:hypothetical protein